MLYQDQTNWNAAKSLALHCNRIFGVEGEPQASSESALIPTVWGLVLSVCWYPIIQYSSTLSQTRDAVACLQRNPHLWLSPSKTEWLSASRSQDQMVLHLWLWTGGISWIELFTIFGSSWTHNCCLRSRCQLRLGRSLHKFVWCTSCALSWTRRPCSGSVMS